MGKNQGVAAETNAVGELQLKWMQLESSSWSERNQGEAAEVNTIGEQQLKRDQHRASAAWHQTAHTGESVGGS